MRKLSKAQQRIVDDLRSYGNSFIQATIAHHGGEWEYAFAKPAEDLHMIMKNGKLTRIDGFYETHRPTYHKAQETIRCLIRKKILVPMMDDKEFAMQFALGTIDHRIYKLAKEYRQ